GEPTALVLEHRDEHTLRLEETCPEHVTVFRSFDEFLSLSREGGIRYKLLILVSSRLYPSCGIPTLHYCPRKLHLGMGCQRLVAVQAAEAILSEVEANGYAREAIGTVGTIELKKDEPLLAELCRLLPRAEKRTYTPTELAAMDVPNPSPLVMGKVGSPSVAEAAALVGSDGGYLVLPKQKGCVDGLFYTFALATERTLGGHIEIVGAGPGATDLISLRGRRFLERADLILFAGSLVPEELTRCAKRGAIVRSSASMSLDEQIRLMQGFYDEGKLVVRLHTGDPSIYGATAEQMARFDALGINYHVTPGISSFQAAAAELRSELTVPFGTQTVILTRHGGGRTPVPDSERLESLAAHGSSMCLFLSASLATEVQEALLKGAYTPDTPVAVCHKVTHRDQRIFRCRLAELAETMSKNGISLTAMIVVGEAVGNRKGQSYLYSE
ncbi:MAG: precorrin-4 C(11)-methyltransferase, partial [Prevotellaceae bacterium]|nr:precorrin-4 C(11)-methyltransferase [Prevotellaceae bacterium]